MSVARSRELIVLTPRVDHGGSGASVVCVTFSKIDDGALIDEHCTSGHRGGSAVFQSISCDSRQVAESDRCSYLIAPEAMPEIR
jgi:hypothetical protein